MVSIRPEIVLPSLAILMKISPGRAVVVEADVDVALVAGDIELVADRAGSRAAGGGAPAARPPRRGAGRLLARGFAVLSGCVRLQPSR